MEKAVKQAGSCGRFQVYHVIFTQLPRFVATWAAMMLMFGSYDPGWRCITENKLETTFTGLQNESRNYSLNVASRYEIPQPTSISLQVVGNNTENSSLVTNINSLNLNSNTSNRERYYYNETCSRANNSVCRGIEFNPVSKTLVSEFELVCDRTWIRKTMMIVQGVGNLVGAIVGGQVGESFGRKVSLYGGTAGIVLFGGLAIFSVHWIMYATCLFFIGASLNSALSTSHIFALEFLNSKWRSFYSSIPTWNFSLIVFALVSLALKNWVYMHITLCILSSIACLGFFVLPESLRWLVVHGHQDRAENVVHRVARINHRPCPSSEVLKSLREEFSDETQTVYTYLDLFKNREVFILTIKFCVLWMIIFLTYFALGYGLSTLPGNFYQNAIASSACEMIVVMLCGPMCHRIGRRWSGFVLSVLGALSCSVLVLSLYTTDGQTTTIVIKVSAFLARSGSQAMAAVGSVFCAELLPTAVRNVSFGFFRTMTGVGSIIAPFLIPVSSSADSFAVCFSIMALSYVAALSVFLSLPETNKMALLDRVSHVRREQLQQQQRTTGDGTRRIRETDDHIHGQGLA